MFQPLYVPSLNLLIVLFITLDSLIHLFKAACCHSHMTYIVSSETLRQALSYPPYSLNLNFKFKIQVLSCCGFIYLHG